MELRVRPVLAIAAALATFLVGLLAGRGVPTAPTTATEPSPTSAADHTPREAEPQEAGFPRTRAGAVEAATAFGLAVDGPALLDADRRTELLAEIAAEEARAELARVLDQGAAFIADNLALTASHLADPSFAWRVVPGGWDLRSYDGDRATVAIWATGIAVSDGRPLADPGWRTTEVDVLWERGSWRLVAFRSEPGPAPSLAGDAADPMVGARINAFAPYDLSVAPGDAP